MKKFLTIAGVLAVIATPAFAQSYDPDFGTGNVINESAPQQQADRADAYSAFAQAPRENADPKIGLDPYSAAVNGGGNEGYNWGLLHDE